MRILLDENMPAKVDYDLGEGHDVHTVKEMRWLGKKNGELLGLAAFNGFELIITLDRDLKHQQNLDKFALKFIVVLAMNNEPETIQPFVEKIRKLLSSVMNTLEKLTEMP